MKRACLFAALALGACVEGPDAGVDIPAGSALPSDAHYVMIPAGYASPEECLANAEQPFSCRYSISLCRDGRAGQLVGDIVLEGKYVMDGPLAHAKYESGETLDFDVQAVAEVGVPSAHWIVDTENRWDTLQFDNINCDYP
jgi:hypothetical protein